MVAADWWATFFEGVAFELWRAAHSDAENRAQAADVARALVLTRGERLLDVPCGDGRLALEFAELGAHVVGIDASEELVGTARLRAAERRLALELVHGDMRALPWQGAFDAALCAGNSFAYFDDGGNFEFLRGVARALVPGGRFLLEYPLVAELALGREYRDARVIGERELVSEAAYDPQRKRLDARYTFTDRGPRAGAAESRVASYRVYAAQELEQLLCEAGFTSIELLGGLDGEPFDETACEFFVRARRA